MKNIKLYLFFLACTFARSLIYISTSLPYRLNGADDSNIFFRYVNNLFDYGQIAWNIGEGPVEGFSSPLWFALLVLVKAFSIDLCTGAYILNILLTAGIVYELFRIIKSFFKDQSNLPAAMLALIPLLHPAFFFWSAVSLMDFTIWNFLLCRLLRKILEGKSCSLMIFLISTCRPEGLGLGLLATGFLFLAKRLSFSKSLATGITCLITIIVRLAYFGYPFPNTYYAKVNEFKFTTPYLYISDYLFQYPIHLAALAVILSLFVLFFIKKISLKVNFTFIAFALLYTGFFIFFIFSVGSEHFEYHRLLLPVTPILIISLGIALSLTPGNIFKIIYALILLIISTLAPAVKINNELYISTVGQKLGQYFNLLFPAEKPEISVIAVGGIGYTYEGDVFDLVGLNDLEMAHNSRERIGVLGHAIFDREIFYRRMPPFVLQGCEVPQERSKNMFFFRRVTKKITSEQRFRDNYNWIYFDLNTKDERLINNNPLFRLKSILPDFSWDDAPPHPDYFCGYIRKDFVETARRISSNIE